MHFVDHLVVMALAALIPWYAWRAQRALAARIRRGERPDRPRLYLHTSIEQWSVLAVLAVLWSLLGRPVTALGFVAPTGSGFWIGAGIASAVLVYLAFVWRKVKSMSAADKAKQVAAMGDLAALLPQNRRDLKAFTVLSFTAGIVEEIVFRGYLFWYFLPLLPAWAVVIVTGLLFGLGHIYQGSNNALRIAAIGIAIGALYLVTGSLWVPIVLHILADVMQGVTIVELHRGSKSRKASGVAAE